MSLINKMLRDLDARHAASGQTVLPDDVRPLPEEIATPRVSRRVWFVVGLALVIAMAIQTSSIWLPVLAENISLPANMLSPPAAVTVAPVPPPTTVVLQLPPPEQMLQLPSLPETTPATAEAPAEQATPTPPVTQEQVPRQIAESRSTALKIDSSLTDIPVRKATSPAVTLPPKQATTAPKPSRPGIPGKIEKQQPVVIARDKAEAEYRKGVTAYKQGHATEAITQFKAALQEDPRHLVARQTLLSMQAEQKQWEEVQSVLKEGLELMPEQVAWAMALARIQVERGKLQEAWETLQRHMAHAEKSADYQGFAGVLLQRMKKPHEAIVFYQAAVQIKPNEGRWWLGLGLAYESDNRIAEARDAFQRARGASGLSPEMAAVIDKKLR